MAALTVSKNWIKPKVEQQKQILAAEGSEADLICTLEQTALPAWKTKTEHDVGAWLAEAKKDLLTKLKDGPIVIS